jgi:hypothetical protein
MTVRRRNVEFDYNGKVRPARLDIYSHNSKSIGNTLVFSYKGINVSINLDEDDIHEHVAQKECTLIDALGEEDYKTFSEFRKKIEEIESSKVVVNNKVYDFYHNESLGSHSNPYHIMSIKMQDGNVIDGDFPSDYFRDTDRKSKTKTFNNLVNKVTQVYRETGIEPDELAVNEPLTLEYMKMKIWINKRVTV